MIREYWQSDWNEHIYKKLHSVKPVLGEWLLALRSVRRDKIVLARLRIGHTWLTHAYLLKGEEAPQCIPCFTQLSLQHIFCFFHFRGLDFRDDYRKVGTLQSIFDCQVLALTATITSDIMADIKQILSLKDVNVVATLPDRPNNFLAVTKCREI